MNVLESVEDPEAVIASLTGCLKPGGALVVLVPQGKALFSSLDQGMGHKRRFDERGAAEDARIPRLPD